MKIHVQGSTPPVVEFDKSVAAWYVRIGKGKVARTMHQEKQGAIVNTDVDRQNRVIGIEMLGIREFTIPAFFRLTGLPPHKVDFTRARFVPASAVAHA